MTKQSNTRRGFTLIETAAVLGMTTLLAGVVLPAVKQTRSSARGVGSAANLAFIGQGAGMYAQDHEDRIFSYTWEPGFHLMPDGKQRVSADDQGAAAWQQTEILMRRTGRIDGPDRLFGAINRLPHKRTILLVLQDYLDRPFPDPMVADPADAKLLQWQANPLDIAQTNDIPYAPGSNTTGYDVDVGWADTGVRQRWAFTSSYHTTVSAWQGDGLNGEAVYAPVRDTPHLFSGGPDIDLASGRRFAEVTFPGAKVYFFEEFDREQAGDPYFAYDHARPEKLMFDGSVNNRASGDANPSWNPREGKNEWRQRYIALHEFPIPLSGFGEDIPLSQRYRWTLGGLKGIDYAAPIMRR